MRTPPHRKRVNPWFTIVMMLLFSAACYAYSVVSWTSGQLQNFNKYVIITRENNPAQFYQTIFFSAILGTIFLGGPVWLLWLQVKEARGKTKDIRRNTSANSPKPT